MLDLKHNKSPYNAKQWIRINMQQQGLLYKSWQVSDLLERLSYVQIDSINVVERAHHHVLQTRINHYSPNMLEQALSNKDVFEYWSHAAAYLPMKDYAYSLYRKRQIAQGDNHWHKPDKRVMHEVLTRIKAEGPLQAKDFEHTLSTTKSGWWDWKPAKKALEQLFMQGDLMSVKRHNFQKVYDLAERVVPSSIDTRVPNEAQFCRYLIDRSLNAHGFASAQQIAYLRKGMKATIKSVLQDMVEENELASFEHNKHTYYYQRQLVPPVKIPNKVWLINPFDNLVIQRKRLQTWYGFDYQIEVYVPEAKRVYGYFSLLILWQERFIGRVSVKADRKRNTLILQHLHFEENAFNEKRFTRDKFIAAFTLVLREYLHFNKSIQWELDKCNDKLVEQMLKSLPAGLQN